MRVCVLDASAMLAFLSNEAGADQMENLLTDPDIDCYAHSVDLIEVFYDTIRESNNEKARSAIAALRSLGIVERSDMDEEFWQSVARLKSRGRISLADCFGIVLAQKLGGEIVTTNHHEFDPLVPDNIVPILFIR